MIDGLVVNLAESLETQARAKLVDPIIAAMTALLTKRFRRQGKLAAAGKTISHSQDLRTAAQIDELLASAATHGSGLIGDSVTIPALSRQGAELLAELDRTSAKEVRSIIKQGLLDGSDQAAIRQAVETAFQNWADARAARVALYEVSTAFHDAMIAAARGAGGDAHKEWLTDSNPCPICADNAGEELGLDEPFASGVQAPPQHGNCRCSMRVFVKAT